MYLAKKYGDVDDHNIELIMHCRKSVLFGDSITWTKKRGSPFDVTMCSYDGADIYQLVGLLKT